MKCHKCKEQMKQTDYISECVSCGVMCSVLGRIVEIDSLHSHALDQIAMKRIIFDCRHQSVITMVLY